MRILKPNSGEATVPILKQNLYVVVTDYGWKKFLKEIKVGPGQHTWEWVSFNTTHFIDLTDINDKYCTFDNAINREVNNAYSTVYGFESFGHMIDKWQDIEYVDNITTVYKSKE